jgi:protein AroM
MQECVNRLEKEGCESMVLLCTGDFNYIKYRGILIEPGKICRGIINATLKDDGVLGVFSPIQRSDSEKKIKSDLGYDVVTVYSNPYDLPEEKIISAANEMKKFDVDMVYMNCLGYSLRHKKIVYQILKKPIILPRMVIAKVLDELFKEI